MIVPAKTALHLASPSSWILRARHRLLKACSWQTLSPTSLQAALLIGVAVVELIVAPRLREPMGDVAGYGAEAVALLAGAIAALLCSRLAEERMKLRWRLVSAWQLCEAITYFAASANNLSPAFDRFHVVLNGAGVLGKAALMLAITISFTGAPLGMIVLDLAQAALFIVLAYLINSGSNPWAKDVQSHVILSLLLALMFFLIAAVAPLSASTEKEQRFFKILAAYLGAAWVGRFLSSQVGYLWMKDRGTLYDLFSVAVCTAMAMFLMESAWQARHQPQPDRELARRRLMLRNLMPSLLALTTFLMALYVFLHAPVLGLLAVLCAALLYLSRTLLLQTHMGHEAAILRQRNLLLEEISYHDTLTGAGNRRSLAANYERCLSDRQHAVAMLLVDLDFFKQANDVSGHLYGDRILQQVAAVLHSASTAVEGSHVARFGGDEFALLLPRVDASSIPALAETIRAAVETLSLHAGHQNISVSIGGVSARGTEPLEELIRRADIALYRAKYRGRNRAEFESHDATPQQDTPSLTFLSAV